MPVKCWPSSIKILRRIPKIRRCGRKKGDVHRRAAQFAEALAAFTKAQEIDEHDFVITMRLSDTRLAQRAAEIKAAEKAGQDVSQAKVAYLDAEIEEYKARQQRQPTELSHSFQLATRLFKKGDIDAAAANFQKALGDPRYKKAKLSLPWSLLCEEATARSCGTTIQLLLKYDR